MSFLTANDHSVATAEIFINLRGVIVCRALLVDDSTETDIAVGSKVVFEFGGLEVVTVCGRQGNYRQRQNMICVGGKGSLQMDTTPKQYRDAPVSLLLKEALPKEETALKGADARFADYIRPVWSGTNELDSLSGLLGKSWNWRTRVDGKLILISDKFEMLEDSEELAKSVISHVKSENRLMCKGDVRFEVGKTLTNYGKIIRVAHRINSGFRTELWVE